MRASYKGKVLGKYYKFFGLDSRERPLYGIKYTIRDTLNPASAFLSQTAALSVAEVLRARYMLSLPCPLFSFLFASAAVQI